MNLGTRKLLDRAFTGLGALSIVLLALSLVVLLAPIAVRGCGAYVFRATVEHRQVMRERFHRSHREVLKTHFAAAGSDLEAVQKGLWADVPGRETRDDADALAGYREATRALEALKPKCEGLEATLNTLKADVAKANWDPAGDLAAVRSRLDAFVAEVAAVRAAVAVVRAELDTLNRRVKLVHDEGATAKLQATASDLARLVGRAEQANLSLDTLYTESLRAELLEAQKAREPVYAMLAQFTEEMKGFDRSKRRECREALRELEEAVAALLGPRPDEPRSVLVREQYGQTRWDRAWVKLKDVLMVETYDYSDPTRMGVKVLKPRVEQFRGTSLERLFPYVEQHLAAMLRPRLTFYTGFLTQDSLDAHFYGGVWPEMLGTLYLTVGAVAFAVPMGVVAAIYLVEYSREGKVVSVLRTFISTLAGVPSIVFGLFGLAFFMNTLHVSRLANPGGASTKSVLAGSLTLALLILPMVIRAAEEAIRAVPQTYKEAALSLGASRWHTVLTVILPAALPGILTGIVLSMGRAAGETAPIIFTAAVSAGQPLKLWQTLTQPTPALPWNIYNVCTEHEAVEEVRHVQYGMVLTLVLLVLLLNVAAIWLRARISRKLRG